MGVEVVAPEKVQAPVDGVSEVDKSVLYQKENGKLDKVSGLTEPIQFGSHGEEPVKAEGNDVTDANLPKDAVDEWPAPKQVHSFYFVTYRLYDDPKIKAKIDQADKEIQKRNQSRFQITEELKDRRDLNTTDRSDECFSFKPFDMDVPGFLSVQSIKRQVPDKCALQILEFCIDSKRAELINQVRALKNEGRQYKSIFDEKKKEMEPLQQALGKLRNTNNAGRVGICSSEEELNDLIYSLQYRMQHESIPLTEEKQILREIKQLEGTREKVIANAAMRTKIQDSLGQKEAIQDQVKLMGVDLDGVRKERQALWEKLDGLEAKVQALDAEIKTLQEELEAVIQKREKTYETLQELRKQRDEANASTSLWDVKVLYLDPNLVTSSLMMLLKCWGMLISGSVTIYYFFELVLPVICCLRRQNTDQAYFHMLACTLVPIFIENVENANFYQSRMLLTKAKELAAKKDVKALEELALDEVEKFMSLWCHNKSFRDDYEKRILPSLDRRQLSRDGRIRNPDEKPLVILEAPKPSEPEPVVKAIPKRAKEDPKPIPPKDTLPTQKVQKEITKTELKPPSEHSDMVDKEISGLENPSKNPSPAEKEVDEAKLKEIKREEEIAKAKQAMERKKKLAEKAAAKAAARAQKDAEKKLKEREKKLKKKAAASAPTTEPEQCAEAVAEAAEPEMVEVNDEVPVSFKEKVRKEKTVRSRNRPRGPDSLPKVITRRKKSTNFWMWAAPAAAFVVLLFLALGYYYLL
ncbi:hypothetical protein POTOM_041103 [Populus tomentosa]|uniref:Proton pump-interactor 1 n=1 Tax=Populus tomentosa TaxID=118781 RepID=A0A8X8CI15_POPTO|nr:hypothetical protein POTOM_041103 [Populus tomentosa]